MCNFPEAVADSIVDALIGQDHIDLHYSRCDVKGQLGEPIARLGPLGWTCISHPETKAAFGVYILWKAAGIRRHQLFVKTVLGG